MLSGLVTHPYAYPALEVVHIAGIALLFGNLVLLELRVWGLNAAVPLEALGKATLTLAVVGFCLAGVSGLTLFASNPVELLTNRSFTLKMGLLMLLGINAGVFHARGGLARLDTWARAQTVLSLGLWLAVIICGRWIAYV